MMDYFHRAVDYVNVNVFKKGEKPQIEIEEPMSKLDGYLNFICKLVIWEDPTLTWISFIFINFVYSIIIYCETRFFCIVFTTAAILVTLDYYDEAINFKNLKRYVYFRDITDMCSSCMYNMHVWKRDNPSFFCGVMTTFFLTLSFIGRTISGRVLTYFFFLSVYFGPTLIKLAPREVQNTFLQFINAIRTTDIVAENELIPLITEDFDNDDINDGDSLKTDRTQDSITTSLISGITSMPSYLDADNEVNDLEEDDLLPEHRSLSGFSRRIDYSSDSDDSDHHDGMHFESQHFIKDTSSSDDECYSREIKFTDVDATTSARPNLSLGAGMVSSLAAVGTNILSNLQSNFASQAATKVDKKMRRDSSDNSDFEIIDKDDANDT